MTKGHEAWRKRMAEESLRNQIRENGGIMPAGDVGPGRYRYYMGFLAGMAAEHDAARLMGRIDGLSRSAECFWNESLFLEFKSLNEQLAAILKKGEG